MKEITVSSNEAGQRFDKLLGKYLREAPKSFIYKMLRKKNITLNGKKAQGNEILREGDLVKLFLAEETIAKFQGQGVQLPAPGSLKTVPGASFSVVYEDDNILLVNKPAGMLTQKAKAEDVSLNEYILQYLLDEGSLTKEELASFRPSICNRLDRNTSGLVVVGKSLVGLQTMSRLLRDRSMRKYYRCIVKGSMTGSAHLRGYLVKDERTNKVSVSEYPGTKEDKPIETEYTALASGNGLTMLEVHLITGRSHQIRAHLASIGHPILGDGKYGEAGLNQQYRSTHGVKAQLLHAYRLEFPAHMEPLEYLSGRSFCAKLPPVYGKFFPDTFH